MMKTYAEILAEKESAMTNYDIDELRRQDAMKRKKEFAEDLIEHEKKSVHDTRIPGKDEVPWTAIDVEVPDEDFIKIAHAAHTRDITINKMVNIMLKKSIEKAEYKFEHDSKPQLLTESYNF